MSIDEARSATRASVINCLASIKAVIGTLDKVRQVVAVHGLINSTLECTDQAAAMNGAAFVENCPNRKGRGRTSNIPKPPRTEVFPFRNGSQAKPTRGAKFRTVGF